MLIPNKPKITWNNVIFDKTKQKLSNKIEEEKKKKKKKKKVKTEGSLTIHNQDLKNFYVHFFSKSGSVIEDENIKPHSGVTVLERVKVTQTRLFYNPTPSAHSKVTQTRLFYNPTPSAHSKVTQTRLFYNPTPSANSVFPLPYSLHYI